MSQLPQPPPMNTSRRGSSGSYKSSPGPSPRSTHLVRGGSASGLSLPPPPAMTTPQRQQQSQHGGGTNYAQKLARSMTIEEMRELHRRALSDAEAKQTELRLVLASRYRELVGSSDEVTKMRERAQELHEIVHALPNLMEKLVNSTTGPSTTITASDSSVAEDETAGESKAEEKTSDTAQSNNATVLDLRHNLSTLPRLVHRALDKNDVYEATNCLMELFRLVSQQTEEYPLATALSPNVLCNPMGGIDKNTETLLRAQIRMIFLHVQTLPAKIIRLSKNILNSAASFGSDEDPIYGAHRSAAALSSLDLLDIHPNKQDKTVQLLDLYFDSKAQLLQSLLNQLSSSSSSSMQTDAIKQAESKEDEDKLGNHSGANTAEQILSKIVLILQYDIILHPYQMFVLRNFPIIPQSGSSAESIMSSLPMFPPSIVQSKASNFLSAHLPLIRTIVKSVLVDIAGTTASALGKIRQSLYDKTDGLECMERLDKNGICTWEDAVGGIVDIPNVLSSSHTGAGPMAFVESTIDSSASDRKFSLWSVLFSNTFSSLVHSLLTTSFQSVHTRVVSTLRLSLANAPPLSAILPHEAYRNTLHIASELDTALLKVSDDAHELLVHAEERVESERRLRQSLYVQTCEIMGRLICELRRMLLSSDATDAVKELIVGRLCHLLKFRLTALPTLLNPNSSPAVLHGTSGMISLLELQSAFDLADDNGDGLITFQEAMEAVDSAFAGTQFHGAELVRETLLLPTSGENERTAITSGGNSRVVTPQDVTLSELTLLLARGLKHEKSGHQSALGTIQESLDQIITTCLDKWAREAIRPHSETLSDKVRVFTNATFSEDEFKRLYAHTDSPQHTITASPVVTNVSPHIIDFLLEVSFTLNRSVCPSDSLLPVPSVEYATSMGIEGTDIPKMMDMIRWSLLSQSADSVTELLETNFGVALGKTDGPLRNAGPSQLAQLKNDLLFVKTCFFQRNKHGFGNRVMDSRQRTLEKLCGDVDGLVRKAWNTPIDSLVEEKHNHVFEVCDLFLTSLLGQDSSSAVPLGDLSGPVSSVSSATSLLHSPLPSSCRFSLLPIQADRTLSGVQARGKYKDKNDGDNRQDSHAAGAVRAGLGFFSSMLKKN